MKILWLTWKDRKNPQAGGAEVVNEELAKRLVQDGHEVIFLVAEAPSAPQEETKDGFKIIRMGTRLSVYWRAYRYYKKNLKDWPDLVIDEINTIPFFAKFYVKQRNILFVHQLAREIWFYQMFFPLNMVGYILEPIYLWILRDRQVIAVSESTKRDLMRRGFKGANISIISEGIEIEPVKNLDEVKKYDMPTILSLGAIRPMKRTLDIVKAFEIAKKKVTELELVIAGDSSTEYGVKVLSYIKKSKYANSIRYVGRVSAEEKIELYRKSHIVAVASVKEGWGLVVTEANSQGTPAVVYNVDGLRDSVRDSETGLFAKTNTPNGLAEAIVKILGDKDAYEKMRHSALVWSKEITFEKQYKDFLDVIQK